MDMNVFLLLLTSLLSGVLSFKFQEELLTKDYLIFPWALENSFVQASEDFMKRKRIERPRIATTVKAIKVKHVGPTIHLYWFEDSKHVPIQLTKVSRNTKGETSPIYVPSKGISRDIDVHPTLDMIFLATSVGLFQINSTTSDSKRLIEGNINLVKYNSKKNQVYFVDCSVNIAPKMKKFDLSSNDVKEHDLDKCYQSWDMDFENDLLYLALGKELFKTSLSNVEKFIRKSDLYLAKTKVRRRSTKQIISLALGSKYLYFGADGERKIFKVQRGNGKEEREALTFDGNKFAVAIYEGPELEKEPPGEDPKKKESPSDDQKKKETPADDQKKKESPSDDQKKKETPADDQKKKEPPAEDLKKKVTEAEDPKGKQLEITTAVNSGCACKKLLFWFPLFAILSFFTNDFVVKQIH